MAKLKTISAKFSGVRGAVTGRTFSVSIKTAITIGRTSENQLVLPDPHVSRKHCEIRLEQGSLVLYDLGSQNGTFVNGNKMQKAILSPGDRIRVGESEIIFHSAYPKTFTISPRSIIPLAAIALLLVGGVLLWKTFQEVPTYIYRNEVTTGRTGKDGTTQLTSVVLHRTYTVKVYDSNTTAPIPNILVNLITDGKNFLILAQDETEAYLPNMLAGSTSELLAKYHLPHILLGHTDAYAIEPLTVSAITITAGAILIPLLPAVASSIAQFGGMLAEKIFSTIPQLSTLHTSVSYTGSIRATTSSGARSPWYQNIPPVKPPANLLIVNDHIQKKVLLKSIKKATSWQETIQEMMTKENELCRWNILLRQLGKETAEILSTREPTFAIAALAIDLFKGECRKPAPKPNYPPTVTLNPYPDSGIAPLRVAFKITCEDIDGTCVKYVWDFGDGKTSTLRTPTHTYSTAGTYTVTLIVYDDRGASSKVTTTISVVEPPTRNNPPEVVIISPIDGTVYPFRARISFIGKAFDPEEGDIPSSALVWYSNRDGEIGRGGYIYLSNLAIGKHRITLSAIDSQRYIGRAYVSIYIESPREANIKIQRKTQSDYIITSSTAGRIKLGMTINQVKNYLGMPRSVKSYESGGCCNCPEYPKYYTTWKNLRVYNYNGLSVLFYKGIVVRIWVSDPRYATADGVIRVGTPIQKVKQVYGERIRSNLSLSWESYNVPLSDGSSVNVDVEGGKILMIVLTSNRYPCYDD